MRTLDKQGFTWSTWFGALEGASYLTDEGRDLASRAARDLEEFFGSKWIRRATDVSCPGRPLIPVLGRTAPLLAQADAFRPGAYIEGIRWWAAMTLLSYPTRPLDVHSSQLILGAVRLTAPARGKRGSGLREPSRGRSGARRTPSPGWRPVVCSPC